MMLCFEILRPILACEWVLANGTPPPIPFEALVERHLPEDLREDVDRLLDMKRTMPELGEGRRIARIDDYIDRSIERIDAAIAALPTERTRDRTELNELFLSIL